MAEFRVIAEGFRFPEGPAVDSMGRVHCVDCDTGEVVRIEGDNKTTLVNTGGIPVAIAFNSFDEMFVTDAGLQAILKVTAEREVSTYCDRANGEPLLGPNDLCFAPDNRLYFTDPRGSSLESPLGRVVEVSPLGQAHVIAQGYAFPNGIALDADAHRLFFAVTWTREIWHGAPGGSPSLFGRMEGDRGPDGMAFDREGRLHAAHFGKGVVAVFDTNGYVVEELDAGGAKPTNCCFGGSDGRTLFVTEAEKGRLIAIERPVPGLPLFRP